MTARAAILGGPKPALDALKLIVTGATGFLGSEVVTAALERNHMVVAVSRRDASAQPMPWDGDARVTRVSADLATEAGLTALEAELEGADAVIHVAAAMSGDDAAHARDTVGPTKALLSALGRSADPGRAPRLILISSFSVYGYAALPEGAQLDETTPLEADPHLRDAYTRAKLAQESAAVAAVQAHGLEVRALRPGVIHGVGRLWSARLGVAFGPIVMRFGPGRVPGIAVERCAQAAVLAAETPMGPSEVRTPKGRGGFEALNLVDADQPSTGDWLAELKQSGWPKAVLPVPWSLSKNMIKVLEVLGILFPGLIRRLPGLMRSDVFHARFKPLRYSDTRARMRLGLPDAPDFSDTVGLRAKTDG